MQVPSRTYKEEKKGKLSSYIPFKRETLIVSKYFKLQLLTYSAYSTAKEPNSPRAPGQQEHRDTAEHQGTETMVIYSATTITVMITQLPGATAYFLFIYFFLHVLPPPSWHPGQLCHSFHPSYATAGRIWTTGPSAQENNSSFGSSSNLEHVAAALT